AKSLEIALNDFHVKKAIGIDNDIKKITIAKNNLEQKDLPVELIHEDVSS
ncbi:MAG: SAM-dependent methyltransferase, partial [Nitrosopumilaceae archaeon]|nr:SAM-dependent methyltransferase [Nitrosopumilaceae archaeon]